MLHEHKKIILFSRQEMASVSFSCCFTVCSVLKEVFWNLLDYMFQDFAFLFIVTSFGSLFCSVVYTHLWLLLPHCKVFLQVFQCGVSISLLYLINTLWNYFEKVQILLFSMNFYLLFIHQWTWLIPFMYSVILQTRPQNTHLIIFAWI